MKDQEGAALETICDCVVMLTWSDWKTEPRSNRYHYATRLARHLPVLFVQPDAPTEVASFEATELPGIQILHVPSIFDMRQVELLSAALNGLGYRRPLLWIYNVHFFEFISLCFAPLKIYHATEDYFVERPDVNEVLLSRLRTVLEHVHLLISASPLVNAHYLERGGYVGPSLVLSNGCDLRFWSAEEENAAARGAAKIALFQGGINWRLDWTLIEGLLGRMSDWSFWFCGRLDPRVETPWKQLARFQNLRYFGELKPEALRKLAREASVGLIPFAQSEFTYVSMPLKAIEYIASGLPVVSVPIKALEGQPHIFHIASNTDEFASAMEQAAAERNLAVRIEERRAAARSFDYDTRFLEFLDWVRDYRRTPDKRAEPANLLVLYDARSIHVNTIQEHLRSFSLYSRHRAFFAAATTADAAAIDLAFFDAVIIHYSVRVNLRNHLAPSYADALKHYPGLKILFIQDEYDDTETAREAIEQLGIQVVYTCVPRSQVADVYRPERFPAVEFVTTLTGFVPNELPSDPPPISTRPLAIGYRGRRLPYWYGDLGQEKLNIGKRMKEICVARRIPVDIEWDDARRIYGHDWYRFLQSCKATLGTESGSNVFDAHGEIRREIERALQQDPDVTYEEVRPRFIAPHEGKARMNQVSPKIFEAIACRTALILFEGEYSGVVAPDRHFIPLRKDFSNVNEVLQKLADDSYLERLTEQAYKDVIEDGRFGYQEFVRGVDALISDRVARRSRLQPISILRGARYSDAAIRQRSRRPPRAGIATDTPLTSWEAEDMELGLAMRDEHSVLSYFGTSTQYSEGARLLFSIAGSLTGPVLRSWRSVPGGQREVVGPRIIRLVQWVRSRWKAARAGFTGD